MQALDIVRDAFAEQRGDARVVEHNRRAGPVDDRDAVPLDRAAARRVAWRPVGHRGLRRVEHGRHCAEDGSGEPILGLCRAGDALVLLQAAACAGSALGEPDRLRFARRLRPVPPRPDDRRLPLFAYCGVTTTGRPPTPYAGWLKWHHYAGLIFGVITFTWLFSGMLSMEAVGRQRGSGASTRSGVRHTRQQR